MPKLFYLINIIFLWYSRYSFIFSFNFKSNIIPDSIFNLDWLSFPKIDETDSLPLFEKVIRPLSNNLSILAHNNKPLSTSTLSTLLHIAYGFIWLATNNFLLSIPVIIHFELYFSIKLSLYLPWPTLAFIIVSSSVFDILLFFSIECIIFNS